jgi:hypothetical protein
MHRLFPRILQNSSGSLPGESQAGSGVNAPACFQVIFRAFPNAPARPSASMPALQDASMTYRADAPRFAHQT